MPFVKLDTGIIRSTLWCDKPASDVFIAALLMAEPKEFLDPQPQLEVDSLDETGFVAPPGWYGFVPAAGVGIINVARLDRDVGIEALRRLGAPDPESRSHEYDGRRLIRIDGGYLVLNYVKYRDRDYTAAERSKRWRERKRRHAVSTMAQRRNVTQAEAEAEAEERRTEEPALPPADQAERAIRLSTDALRTKLYALVTEAVRLDPKRRDPTELMRLFTSYQKPDGTQVKGVVNASLLSHERLEYSIRDAEEQIEDWNGQRTAKRSVS